MMAFTVWAGKEMAHGRAFVCSCLFSALLLLLSSSSYLCRRRHRRRHHLYTTHSYILPYILHYNDQEGFQTYFSQTDFIWLDILSNDDIGLQRKPREIIECNPTLNRPSLGCAQRWQTPEFVCLRLCFVYLRLRKLIFPGAESPEHHKLARYARYTRPRESVSVYGMVSYATLNLSRRFAWLLIDVIYAGWAFADGLVLSLWHGNDQARRSSRMPFSSWTGCTGCSRDRR